MEDVRVIEEFLRPRNTGSGYGCGNGSGCGDGSGNGSGYGDGYGDGSGLKEFCGERIWYIDDVPTLIDHVRGDHARGRIINADFTTAPCYIARVDNYFAHGDTLHKAVIDAEAKALENMPIEERIAKFKAEFASLSTKAKCSEFYKWHHLLTGSCTMGRDAFVKSYNLDMNKKYTVEYFLDITSDSYGKEIIKQLKQSYD